MTLGLDSGRQPSHDRRMKAWTTGDAAGAFQETDRPIPTPTADEVLVRIEACGVCRTDLHVIDHELPPHRPGVIPGHQVVGTISDIGPGVQHLRPGDRVGIAWLRRTCGSCGWCRQGRENLCPSSQYTGWDADGGYAEYATVPEPFAYALPSTAEPAEIAPLLCAGIIGFRALSRANLPPGGRLGIYGFGSSAHITAKLAMAAGAQVYAMTRGERTGTSRAASALSSSETRPPGPRRPWTARSSSPPQANSSRLLCKPPTAAGPSFWPEST